jgi:hypothetical protein
MTVSIGTRVIVWIAAERKSLNFCDRQPPRGDGASKFRGGFPERGGPPTTASPSSPKHHTRIITSDRVVDHHCSASVFVYVLFVTQ